MRSHLKHICYIIKIDYTERHISLIWNELNRISFWCFLYNTSRIRKSSVWSGKCHSIHTNGIVVLAVRLSSIQYCKSRYTKIDRYVNVLREVMNVLNTSSKYILKWKLQHEEDNHVRKGRNEESDVELRRQLTRQEFISPIIIKHALSFLLSTNLTKWQKTNISKIFRAHTINEGRAFLAKFGTATYA